MNTTPTLHCNVHPTWPWLWIYCLVFWLLMFGIFAFFAVGRWNKSLRFLLGGGLMLAILAFIPTAISFQTPRDTWGRIMLLWPAMLVMEWAFLWGFNRRKNRRG